MTYGSVVPWGASHATSTCLNSLHPTMSTDAPLCSCFVSLYAHAICSHSLLSHLLALASFSASANLALELVHSPETGISTHAVSFGSRLAEVCCCLLARLRSRIPTTLVLMHGAPTFALTVARRCCNFTVLVSGQPT